MELSQSLLLNLAVGASKEERGEFLRRYLDLLPDDELFKVNNLVVNAKKRRKRKQAAGSQSESRSEPPKRGSEPAPVKASVSASQPQDWWRKYKPSQVYAIDVEKVEVPNPNPGRPKYFQLAGEVAVVNHKGQVIYSEKIQHEPCSFRVNLYAKNGFTRDSLRNGRSSKKVQEELQELFNGKLVIGLALEEDFKSLGLVIGDGYEVFDLQWEWFRSKQNDYDATVYEPLGLRSLCKYYFKIDMQPDSVFHCAAVDASWTMDLFRDVYVKLDRDEPTLQQNACPYDEIAHFSNLYKQFSPSCHFHHN